MQQRPALNEWSTAFGQVEPESRHRDRQERLDRKNRDRQHRETLDAVKTNKSGGDAHDLRL